MAGRRHRTHSSKDFLGPSRSTGRTLFCLDAAHIAKKKVDRKVGNLRNLNERRYLAGEMPVRIGMKVPEVETASILVVASAITRRQRGVKHASAHHTCTERPDNGAEGSRQRRGVSRP
jgi:hypothetical protein